MDTHRLRSMTLEAMNMGPNGTESSANAGLARTRCTKAGSPHVPGVWRTARLVYRASARLLRFLGLPRLFDGLAYL